MRNISLTLAIVFTILTIFIGVSSFDLITLSFQDPVDIYDEDFDIVEHGEGGHIKTELYASYGECASEVLTTTNNGTVTSRSTDYYFVIPVFDNDNDEEYLICVQIDEGDYSLFNKMSNETINYIYGDIDYFGSYTYNFDGTIEELDEELYDYMLEYFRDSEWYEDEADLRAHVLPLCLNTMHFDGAPSRIVMVVVFLLLAILFWVLFFVKRSKIKAANAAAANGMAMNNGMYNGTYNDATLNSVPVANPDPYNTQYNNQYGQTGSNEYTTPTYNTDDFNNQNNNQ